jgi:hypothetical protein
LVPIDLFDELRTKKPQNLHREAGRRHRQEAYRAR